MSARIITPLPAVADLSELGPCMSACTIGERNWVQAKLETGLDNSKCAEIAGFSNTNADTLKSTGWRLAHSERVQSALLEQSKRFLKTELPKSLAVILEIRDNKAVKPETRLKAAVEIINRGGMNIVTEGHMVVEHQLSDAQMDQQILALAAKLGLDENTARRMLISPADMDKNSQAIDAEWSDVPLSDTPKNIRRRQLDAMTPDERKAEAARVRAERSAKAKARYEAAQMSSEGLEDLLGDIEL